MGAMPGGGGIPPSSLLTPCSPLNLPCLSVHFLQLAYNAPTELGGGP